MSVAAPCFDAPTLSPYASPDFNVSFWHELKYLANDVARVLGDELVAVVLGGGFGRSEGCITWVDGHEVPYNDVDLFLVTRTSSVKSVGKLKELTEHYEQRLKIAVDFSRPQTETMIARWKPLLMWQELVQGHLVLYGPEDILSRNVGPAVLTALPVVEGGRLLLNRGAGLLWAARIDYGLDAPPDPSFVVRNYFKCAQALADATLIAFGQYCSDPLEKSKRLSGLIESNGTIEQFQLEKNLAAAYDFRRAPYAGREIKTEDLRAMAQQWCQLLLWLENRRLGSSFTDVSSYIAWTGRREPNDGAKLRKVLANLRRRRIGVRHPREAVYRCLTSSLLQYSVSDPGFVATSLHALQDWKGAQ